MTNARQTLLCLTELVDGGETRSGMERERGRDGQWQREQIVNNSDGRAREKKGEWKREMLSFLRHGRGGTAA